MSQEEVRIGRSAMRWTNATVEVRTARLQDELDSLVRLTTA
jgi:hypothetical protein